MANISEHNTELERKGNDGENSRINFSVASSTIRVDDILETYVNLKGI